MKEINVQKMINESGLIKLVSLKLSEKLNIPQEKIEEYMNKKVESKLNKIGEQLSESDMTPEEFNKSRRLSQINFDDINDKLIKDE